MNYKILSKVQKEIDTIKDTHKHIKDLEMELEFLYAREPNEINYIISVEKQVDELYEKLEELEKYQDDRITQQ